MKWVCERKGVNRMDEEEKKIMSMSMNMSTSMSMTDAGHKTSKTRQTRRSCCSQIPLLNLTPQSKHHRPSPSTP